MQRLGRGTHVAREPDIKFTSDRMERFGGPGRNRTDVQGFAVLCITTLPPGQWIAVRTHGMDQAQVEIVST